jgi:hypothetical protein
MAMDIFTGMYIKAEVGSAGTALATDFVEVPEVASFTTSGFESTVTNVKTFNSAYDRKILGTKNVPDITLDVNYLPDNEVHQKLEQLAEDQKRCQIKLSYFEYEDQETGFYVVYQCFVSSTTISSDKDEVIKKTFTLAVDGGAKDKGLISVSASA